MSDEPYILDGLTGERRPISTVDRRLYALPRVESIVGGERGGKSARLDAEALLARIRSALGTDEYGDGLVRVAEHSHTAEQALAAVVLRARENPTEHVAHALRAVKVD